MHTSRATHTGFTLLELLLTLSVLAIIASLTLPGLALLLGDRSLIRAGDQLATEMNRARVDAMRQGRVIIIEAALDGHVLRKKPFFSASDATEAFDQTGSQVGLLNGAAQATVTPINTEGASETLVDLPASVQVTSVLVASAARDSQMVSQDIGGSTSRNAAAFSGDLIADTPGNWSSPIFFYPDGTTSTAAVTIQAENVGKVIVRLRGITGEAIASEVTSQ